MVWLWFDNRRDSESAIVVPSFGRQVLVVGAGVLVSVLVVLGPFLVVAPSQFVREVIFFQMLRPSDGVIDTPARIADLTSSLGNALTPLFAAAGFAVLSLW